MGATGQRSSGDTPRVVIVGAGAIGGFYGAILHRAGAQVELVMRSDADVVREHGLTVESDVAELGDLSFRPHAVYDARATPVPGADFVVCCVKVLPGVDRAALIAPWLGPESVVALIENGIDIEPAIRRALPDHRLVSGLAFVAVSRVAPGRLHHHAYGRVSLGNWPGGVDAAATRLAEWLEAGGIAARTTESIVADRWGKSLWNTPFNPVSVLADGTDTNVMLDTPGGEVLIRALMAEVAAVAAADGHTLSEAAIDKNIAATRTMNAYRNSMALDYRAGRALEIEAILGNVCDLAERYGVAVPRLSMLRTLIALKQAEAKGLMGDRS